ncbi:MAG TPA: HTTM domain-containing protein [Flavobacteriaceae bacterium]|nr:HTTM domain-containing protein [Flavobacteriaceae bacterium]
MLNTLLFKQIDNTALLIFRVIFGLLCFLESVGAIFTGWIKKTLIEPQFTFTFIGFEWLQPLPGNGMYFYYLVMGILGLFIMIGYKYRLSIIGFTVMWTATYLMQKSSYNNHYYLLILLSALMVFMPANRYFALDAKYNPKLHRYAMPQWCVLVFIFQMFIVYTYAALAKIYPDWLDLSVMKILMQSKQNYFLVGSILQEQWLQTILAYGGILFDGLIIPLFLIKKTRKLAFVLSLVFHLFNSFVFQIGIFPYLSLAFALFFFSKETIHRLFLKNKPFYHKAEVIIPKHAWVIKTVLIVYFTFQLLLPVRHYFIPGDVFWTEEGHRMSWRMMLRVKSGFATYTVVDKKSGEKTFVKMQDYLTPKQIRSASTKPDCIWQFSQYLKKEYQKKGKDIHVYVDCKVSLNGSRHSPFIDPETDLANISWEHFKHSSWLLPQK